MIKKIKKRIPNKFLRSFLVLNVCFLLLNCAPKQRLARLLDKYPFLIENSLDTLKIADTVIIDKYVHDTTRIIESHDTTIIVNNEKVYAKYIFDTITNEIYHYIECKTDTITYIKEIPFEVEKVVYQEKTNYKFYITIAAVLFGMFLLLVFLKQIKDLIK